MIVDYQAIMAQQHENARYLDMDQAFHPIFHEVRRYTMTSVERMFDLYKSVEYLQRAGIAGDILECGVWRGGSMMLAARTLQAIPGPARRIWLLDTFAGHPHTDRERDIDVWGHAAEDDWQEEWAAVSEDEVNQNMKRVGLNMKHVGCRDAITVKGMVEHTAPNCSVDEIALLRLDTDWYSGMKAALEAFWPRLVSGGVLIMDDYGHYKGQREAFEEYFADKTMPKLSRIDYSCRSAVKA